MTYATLVERIRSNRGFTAIELMVAIGIFAIVSVGGVQLLVSAGNSYNQDITHMAAQQGVQIAMRRITDALRPAISVVVDSGGQGITYYYPRKDAYGRVISPVTSDGIARRIYRGANTKELFVSGYSRPIIKNLRPVDTTDPLFALTSRGRGVLVSIVSSTNSGTYSSTCRKSEVVHLRSLN